MLPDFYKSFFGSDYAEQFNLVVKNQHTDNIYHQTNESPGKQTNPEVRQRIGDLELQSFVILFANKSEDNDNGIEDKNTIKQVLDST